MGKRKEKSENFVSPEKWEPWYFMNAAQIYSDKILVLISANKGSALTENKFVVFSTLITMATDVCSCLFCQYLLLFTCLQVPKLGIS